MSRKFTDEEVVEAALCCTAKSCDTCPFIVLGEGFEKCIIKFSEYIANNTKNEPAPAADVQEVKRGHWIPERDPDEGNRIQCYHCSVCDDDFHYIGAFVATKYCPNCGAKCDI